MVTPRYASARNTVYAIHGMVAASQPLAAAAGLAVLRAGGNAVDAAIATAAALTVVEPTSNGIGGDAFALVYAEGKLHGLNASGIAPAALSIPALRDAGMSAMPRYGFAPVLVPGVPAAWAALSRRFGRLPLVEVLAPAIDYAANGYPVSPHVAGQWKRAADIYAKNLDGPEYASWFATFTNNGKSPSEGEIWRLPDHADTLRDIGATQAESFYHGRLADAVDAFARRYHGYIRKEDLARYSPLWVEPIRTRYKGAEVCEIPPNGQGIVALAALAILAGDSPLVKEDDATYHLQIEAMKLAFADGFAQIADPRSMRIPAEALLDPRYAAVRRALIGARARLPEAGKPQAGGTVYFAVADGEGGMVSYIQSNYMGFGSGLVVPGTGIALQNRGHNFSLDPTHPNALAPGKRSYHTIIPGFMMRDGAPVGPFGVMGGFMQPQGHLQVVMNTLDFHMDPQTALDAPRWQWLEGNTVLLEPAVPETVIAGLVARGHAIRIEPDLAQFGRGQIIWRDPETGVLAGGTEPRCDGSIAAW